MPSLASREKRSTSRLDDPPAPRSHFDTAPVAILSSPLSPSSQGYATHGNASDGQSPFESSEGYALHGLDATEPLELVQGQPKTNVVHQTESTKVGDCGQDEDQVGKGEGADSRTSVHSPGAERALRPSGLSGEGDQRELLVTWALNASEKFNAVQCIVEIIGQSAWLFFGPLSMPLLFVLYGGKPGLQSRDFWPRAGQPFRGWVSYIIFGLIGILVMASLICFIRWRPADVDYSELVFALILVFMRAVTISIKYAYLPKVAWQHLNNKPCSQERMKSLLLIAKWLRVSQETADFYAELSFVTILGPSVEGPRLRFLPWPTSNTDHSRQYTRLQGRTTRESIAHLIMRGKSNEGYNIPEGVDISAECPPLLEQTVWPWISEDGSPCTNSIQVRDFFKSLLASVLEEEDRSVLQRRGKIVNVLTSMFLTLLPGIVRVADGHSFFGDELASHIVIGLYIMPMFMAAFSCVSFLHVAVLEMWRRGLLIRCCSALLSTRTEDRQESFQNIPWQVRGLYLLDLSDAETVEALWLLRGLCMDWGKLFSLRVEKFFEAFAAALGLAITWMLILIVYKNYDAISRMLLVLVVTSMAIIGALVTLVALLGEGVNSASARLGYLLEMHAAALETEAVLIQHDDQIEKKVTLEAVRSHGEFISIVAARIVADQEWSPVKLFGLTCNLGLIGALYFIPVLVGSQIWNLCRDRPSLCFWPEEWGGDD